MTVIIRVLIVDDSAYIRKVVREILSGSPFIEVVGTARNGAEALQMAEELRPDVVTSDLIMPELDGVGFVTEQMRRRALPIVLMSSLDEGRAEVLTALEAGAVDFVQKPTSLASEKLFEVRERLVDAVKAAASADPSRLLLQAGPHSTAVPSIRNVTSVSNYDAVVIGISTGGPQALRFLIPQLPEDFPVPIAIVMHMPPGYTAMYAQKLNEISRLEVVEASDGAELRPGVVLLARAGKHLYFRRTRDGSVVSRLSMKPHDVPHRPSVDVMFQSAAETYGGRTLGLIMTGMGTDGRAGAATLRESGGTVFAESDESCVVFGMPGAVIEAGLANRVVRLDSMAQALLEVV